EGMRNESKSFLAAVVQLTTTRDPERSLKEAEDLVAKAARLGAELVALPENVSFMGSEEEKLRLAEPLSGPSFARLSALAAKHGVWLLGGTMPETNERGDRAYNTSTLWSPDGKLA